MKKKLLALSIGSGVYRRVHIFVHAEGNIKAGKKKAAACASCHGENRQQHGIDIPQTCPAACLLYRKTIEML